MTSTSTSVAAGHRTRSDLPLLDLHPSEDRLIDEVLAGFDASPRTLPCKLLYDQRGSALFDQICELPEYYPTRTELAIMRRHVADMAQCIGEQAMLVELGSGSSIKTELLLDELAPTLAAYVPLDISRQHLLASASRIVDRYPSLEVLPVCADYMQALKLPTPTQTPTRTVAYFPGSTIGNFHPEDATAFLDRIARLVGPGGGLIIGVDLRKSPAILEPAYDDSAGVTAAFNVNMLHRLRHAFDADLDPEAFGHRAVWNRDAGRIEMHLVSNRAQVIALHGRRFTFNAGDSIRTECSYKHTLDSFADLARAFAVRRVWTDPNDLFSVQYLEVMA